MAHGAHERRRLRRSRRTPRCASSISAHALCQERGLILVDTKYEFGSTQDGEIVVIDEIHTPDSSRFWFARQLRRALRQRRRARVVRQRIRAPLLAKLGFKGDGRFPPIPDDVRVEATRRYIEAYETITGESFAPDLEEPATRACARNLGLS